MNLPSKWYKSYFNMGCIYSVVVEAWVLFSELVGALRTAYVCEIYKKDYLLSIPVC
jgi:hypothetical protein